MSYFLRHGRTNYNELQEFRRQQSAFNQRQDEFNIIFLDEIRGLHASTRDVRHDLKTLQKECEARLRREDFMNGFRNAA